MGFYVISWKDRPDSLAIRLATREAHLAYGAGRIKLGGPFLDEAGQMVGSLLIIGPWPWTLIVIRPVNDALLAMDPGTAGPQSRALIVKWGAIHAVRTVMGVLATAAFFWACLSY